MLRELQGPLAVTHSSRPAAFAVLSFSPTALKSAPTGLMLARGYRSTR